MFPNLYLINIIDTQNITVLLYFPSPNNNTMVLFFQSTLLHRVMALFSKITPGLIYGKYRYVVFTVNVESIITSVAVRDTCHVGALSL